jgi:hypothetical protein
MAATPTSSNGLNALLSETGKIYLSVDGNGTTSPTGFIQVLKNSGATVRKAYLIGDGTGVENTNALGTSATVNGTNVSWERIESIPYNGGTFYSYLSDVTAAVKSTIDAAAPGTLNIAVDEGSETAAYEGLALAVVFDDPNQAVDQSVILYFGGLNPSGGTATINFASPVNTRSTLAATLGLGIGYSFNDGIVANQTAQVSQITVNDQLLTAVAGNFDDGQGDNGALFTVGGLGDGNNNPAAGSTDISTDDELYNLLPFIRNGDTALTLNTVNPSNDDHIFFAHLTLQGITGTDSTNVVQLAIAPASVAEDGNSNLIYTFTRSGATTNPLTVSYTVGGTAEFINDYTQTGAASFTATTGTVTFAAGAATATVAIDPIADTITEPNETVALSLVTGVGYAVGTSTAVTGTILSPNPDPTTVLPLVQLAVSPAGVSEDGNSNLIYTFTRSGATTNPLTVSYAVGGTAEFTNDYTQTGAASFTATTGTVTFAAGAATATVAVDPIADNIDDPNEGVSLTLTTGVGYTVGTATAVTGTILNPEVIPEPPAPNALNLRGVNNLDVGAINSLTNNTLTANPSDIILTGNEINLVGGSNSIVDPGQNLTIQSFTPSQTIQIGGSDSGSASTLDLTSTDLAAIANGFKKIIFGRADGSGSININANVSFRDPVLLRSPNGQVNITAPITLTDDATLDFETASFLKSGNSTLTLNGNTATTRIGSTTINGGSLALAKTGGVEALNNAPILLTAGVLQLGNNEQINNAADLTLNGGTFNLNGFNETLDRLQVSSNSLIDWGNSSSDLVFSDSSTLAWTGVLTINNWSNSTGETLRFGSTASSLTSAQLSNIQFAGFSRGAQIDATGFVTPLDGSSPVAATARTILTTDTDQDGVNDSIENLAPNNGDGNRDGIPDRQQGNVASVLTTGGTTADHIATLVTSPGTQIVGLQLLPNPIAANNLTSLANPAEFKVTGLQNGAATTVEFLIAQADQNRKYNTYLMLGKTADNPTTHLYEFLYDGKTGAELFDTNNDGFTDRVIVHFIDGQRGDSDLTVNGEIQDPGAPGIANATVSLNQEANNVIQVAGTAGGAVANFSLVANRTQQVNEVGFFRIDANNQVNGLAPTASGYAQAALQNGQVIFSTLTGNLLAPTDIVRQLPVGAGDRFGFYLVKNGSVDTALQKNDFSNVVFSSAQANPGGTNYLQISPAAGSGYRLKWEQGNVNVDDDLILDFQLNNTALNNQNLLADSQGDRESELLDLRAWHGQNVQVDFTVQREAAYNDTVGFYQVEDAQGTVISLTGARLTPGQVGYAAAVVQGRIAGLDLAVANGGTTTTSKTLQGGAIYAPFLIANASPTSLNGNFSNVYTPYALGNGDTTDHIRLLGNNSFGFEDLAGGGDRDFNDVVLKAVFRGTAPPAGIA